VQRKGKGGQKRGWGGSSRRIGKAAIVTHYSFVYLADGSNHLINLIEHRRGWLVATHRM
jgi:hypothetical protein